MLKYLFLKTKTETRQELRESGKDVTKKENN